MSDIADILVDGENVDKAALRSYLEARDVINGARYGMIGDGSNNTVAAEAAIAAAKGLNAGGILWIKAGTYGLSESTPNYGLYINDAITVRGAGVGKTILKNLSATGALLRCANGYIDIANLTLDNNLSTGICFRQGGQYSKTTNVEIKNQAGAATYAFVIDGSTLADVENVFLSACTNGIDIGPTTPTNYVSFRQVTIEHGVGKGLRITTGSGIRFYGLHIESVDAAVAVEKFMYIDNCSEIDFYNFTCETGGNHTLSDAAYFDINNSKSVNFRGGRISHTGTVSKAIFRTLGTTNQNINFDGLDIISTKTGMTLFLNSGTLSGRTIKNIRTVLTATAIGVDDTAAVAGPSTIADWIDNNAASTFSLNAVDLLVINVRGNIALTTQLRQTLINCSGTISGTGADVATIINTSLQSSGSIWAARAAAIAAGGTAGLGLKLANNGDFGIFFGSGAPTINAAKGSLYLRTDGSSTSTRSYINTDGAGTWTAITTAA